MANSVVSAVPDPMTNNYRYKLGRGTLTKVGESEYKTDLTRMSLKPRPSSEQPNTGGMLPPIYGVSIMKKLIALAIAAMFGMPAMAAVDEATAMDIAKKNGCLACHALDKKLVGPAWKEVGKKYSVDPAAAEQLVVKVKKGTKEHGAQFRCRQTLRSRMRTSRPWSILC